MWSVGQRHAGTGTEALSPLHQQRGEGTAHVCAQHHSADTPVQDAV